MLLYEIAILFERGVGIGEESEEAANNNEEGDRVAELSDANSRISPAKLVFFVLE